jgi:hypothetical protein
MRQPPLRRRAHRPHLAARRPRVRLRRAGRARHRAAATGSPRPWCLLLRAQRRARPPAAVVRDGVTRTLSRPAGWMRWRPPAAGGVGPDLPTNVRAAHDPLVVRHRAPRRTAARMAERSRPDGRPTTTAWHRRAVLAQHRRQGRREVPRPADPRAWRVSRRESATTRSGVPVVRSSRYLVSWCRRNGHATCSGGDAAHVLAPPRPPVPAPLGTALLPLAGVAAPIRRSSKPRHRPGGRAHPATTARVQQAIDQLRTDTGATVSIYVRSFDSAPDRLRGRAQATVVGRRTACTAAVDARLVRGTRSASRPPTRCGRTSSPGWR